MRHSRSGLPPCGLDTKILTAILDSLELVSKNLSAIDSNAEENFKTIVHSLDLVSRNNKKNATSLSVQFDNVLRNPLSINPEMTKVIAENTAKSEQACSKLRISVDKLNTDLTSTADYIVSSLRQDAILENSANNSELNTVKDLLIQQNIRTEGLKTEFSEQIKLMQSNLSQEIKNSLESIAKNVASQLKQSGYVGTTAQSHSNSPPRFNNPYMDEKILRNDRDSAPHIGSSHPIAAPQQTSRNSQPHFNESESNCAQPQQHPNYNRAQSRYNTMDYATLNKLLPPVTDWPKFDGADDYDHISFIKYIDHILLSYNADDESVLCRLPRLFEGVALQWFITKQESLGKQSWNTWKQLIKAHFGTRVWEQKIRKAFESDYFDPTKDKPHKWCLTQKKRIDCMYKNPTQLDINDKLLDQCKGHLEHQMRWICI
jgi:hypothetical protein